MVLYFICSICGARKLNCRDPGLLPKRVNKLCPTGSVKSTAGVDFKMRRVIAQQQKDSIRVKTVAMGAKRQQFKWTQACHILSSKTHLMLCNNILPQL